MQQFIKTTLIFFMLTLCLVYCQTNQKLVKVQVQQIYGNPIDLKIDKNKLITIEQFIKKLEDNPASIVQLRNVYITNWYSQKTPVSASSSVTTTTPASVTPATSTRPQPVTPNIIQQPQPTKTPSFTPPSIPQASASATITSSSSSPSTNNLPSKTTTITTKSTQSGSEPAQTTTTTTSAPPPNMAPTLNTNNFLLNPNQNALSSVLSKLSIPNNPFGNMFDVYNLAQNSANGNNGVSASASSSMTTYTPPGSSTPKTVSETMVSTTGSSNNNDAKSTATATTTSSPSSFQPESMPGPAASRSKTTTASPSSSAPVSSLVPPSITTLREQMRALTNNLRTKRGVGSLTINSLLNEIAQEHSEDMINRNFFNDQNPDGESPTDRARRFKYNGSVAQNIAKSISVNSALTDFETNTARLNNCINPDWEQIGVGIATQGSLLYITVLFSPRNIVSNPLTSTQVQQIKSALTDLIKEQNPALKFADVDLSYYIKQWLDTDRNTKLVTYVTNKGFYRTPLTAANQELEYSKNLVEIAKKNRYFVSDRPLLTKFGLGLKQKQSKIEIYVIYM